jgi:hypothetical protein
LLRISRADLAYDSGLTTPNEHKEVRMIADTPVYVAEREQDDNRGMWRWSFALLMLAAVLIIVPLRKLFRRN